MRVLYIASAVEAEGTSGGSTHVREVACGLKALGHTVLVIARRSGEGKGSTLDCGMRVLTTRTHRGLEMLGLRQIARAVYRFKPDVVMERFYNFAGAGVLLAHRAHIPILLEVNAPMTDPPGSLKSRLDRLLLGVMRRWAVRQGTWSSAIVTPLANTVPPEVPRDKIHELPWGANIDRFDPQLRVKERERLDALRGELGLGPSGKVAVFLGSFRAWHGVSHFAQAARTLIQEGAALSFLAVGDGPELNSIREDARAWCLPEGRLAFTGPQPHEKIPDLLSIADIGVAPFDPDAHAPLKAFGFYWSPLKVFEYMAAGLPVVTIDVHPLNEIVRHEREGLLYPAGNVGALTATIKRLVDEPLLVEQLGKSARERVVSRYSWRHHCEALDNILRSITDA